MSKEQDEEDGALKLNLDDPKKMKPPNKKKFDEDMDGLTNQIKEREAELERTRQVGVQIKKIKAERMDLVNRRKQIIIDLEKITKEISARTKYLNEIEATLYYKSEDKINSAIQRLEWNLGAKTYKLSEEKKIVSEIDSLKRSKKTLVQYLTLRQENSEIRDKQKSMRDERDSITKESNRLRMKEEELRHQSRSLTVIKREIDALYDQRRQTNANFKQQRGEFHELKEKHRKESWKKKAEERKAYEEEKRREQAEIEAERLPHESDLHLCVTLSSYLNRLLPALTDNSQDSLSPASSQDDPEPVEEMDDGQFRLLRKSDEADTLDHTQRGIRKLSKRNRKIRKHSMDKKIAHPSDVLNQFMSLNLMAPTCLFEVPDVLDQLEKKRNFFEKEQQQYEATSDAGISATESAVCAMSRQASKTESCEGGIPESRPDDSVYTALFQQQDKGANPGDKDEYLCGAVGGQPEEEDWSSVVAGVGSDTPNSDSTIEGDAGSGDSQKLVETTGDGDMERQKNLKKVIHDKPELKRSLAISVSDSMDGSVLQMQRSGQMTSLDQFPSLLESSQSSVMSDGSFLSFGASASSLSPREDRNNSTSRSSGHPPLTKTASVVPWDPRINQTQNTKSYASSVVGRTRSFSDVITRKPSTGTSNVSKPAADSAGKSPKSGQSFPPFSQQHIPPSSLSLSFSSTTNYQSALSPSTPSSKPRPSIHRSRTLTPTLTRTWTDIRGKGKKSQSGSGNTPGSGASANCDKDKSPMKAQVSPSLSSSSIPTPHKSLLSPRLSYPLHSKPSPTPTRPIILIDDDKDFPPLSQTSSLPRRNSNLSNKSSSGSISIQVHDHSGDITNKNNNNNNNNNSNSVQGPTCQSSLTPVSSSAAQTSTANNLSLSSSHHHIQLPDPEADPDLSSIPKGDKSSTEKWVESSMAFVQDLSTSNVTNSPDLEVTQF